MPVIATTIEIKRPSSACYAHLTPSRLITSQVFPHHAHPHLDHPPSALAQAGALPVLLVREHQEHVQFTLDAALGLGVGAAEAAEGTSVALVVAVEVLALEALHAAGEELEAEVAHSCDECQHLTENNGLGESANLVKLGLRVQQALIQTALDQLVDVDETAGHGAHLLRETADGAGQLALSHIECGLPAHQVFEQRADGVQVLPEVLPQDGLLLLLVEGQLEHFPHEVRDPRAELLLDGCAVMAGEVEGGVGEEELSRLGDSDLAEPEEGEGVGFDLAETVFGELEEVEEEVDVEGFAAVLLDLEEGGEGEYVEGGADEVGVGLEAAVDWGYLEAGDEGVVLGGNELRGGLRDIQESGEFDGAEVVDFVREGVLKEAEDEVRVAPTPAFHQSFPVDLPNCLLQSLHLNNQLQPLNQSTPNHTLSGAKPQQDRETA